MFKAFKRKRHLLTWIHIAIGIGIIFSIISLFNFFQGIQWRITDNLFRGTESGNSAEAVEDIVIIAIDDKSLEQLGYYSTWPRAYYAEAIDGLARSGARVIVFDVLFSEPTPDDAKMAESMEEAGNVILPFVHSIVPDDSGAAGRSILITGTINPLDVFKESAAATAHAVVFPDKDGTIRRLPLIIENNEEYEPSLALAAVSKYLRRPGIIESPPDENTLSFAGRTVPLDGAGCMTIRYSYDTAPVNFIEISFVDLLRGAAGPDVIRDKIAVIGATATGISDKFWTPGRLMNGVEVHAAAMQTLLSARFLQPASPAADMILIWTLVFLCSLAVIRLRVTRAVLSAVFLCGLYYLIAFLLFDKGIVMNMLHPPLAAIGSFAGMTIYCVIYERSEKAEITKTFGRYISAPVVNKILAAQKEGNLQLGGESQEVTVMFADIRHFTSISENIHPETVFNLLNSYMSLIIESVQKYDGIVNKFGGDSVLAIWNAPLKSYDHALLAARAAIDAQRAISRFNDSTEYLLNAEFGIGINTGEAMIGNVGSKERLEYTVIGDAVNVAARMGGAAPGGKIWIGAGTYERIRDGIPARQLAPLPVKGRHEPVQTYEIEDISELKTADVLEHAGNF